MRLALNHYPAFVFCLHVMLMLACSKATATSKRRTTNRQQRHIVKRWRWG